MLTVVATKSVRKTLAESPRVPVLGEAAQGESAPKARANAVVDGKQVNIPRRAGGDEWRKLSGLIGLPGPRSCSRKQPPLIDRTRNRHRWTGRAYQGA